MNPFNIRPTVGGGVHPTLHRTTWIYAVVARASLRELSYFLSFLGRLFLFFLHFLRSTFGPFRLTHTAFHRKWCNGVSTALPMSALLHLTSPLQRSRRRGGGVHASSFICMELLVSVPDISPKATLLFLSHANKGHLRLQNAPRNKKCLKEHSYALAQAYRPKLCPPSMPHTTATRLPHT